MYYMQIYGAFGSTLDHDSHMGTQNCYKYEGGNCQFMALNYI